MEQVAINQVWKYTGEDSPKQPHRILWVDKEDADVTTVAENLSFSGLFPIIDFLKNFTFLSEK